MSELETSGRPSALTIEQQQQPRDTSASAAHVPKNRRRKRSSTISNSLTADTNTTFSRRHSETTNEITTRPNPGSSLFAQRSTISPHITSVMSTVNYTKTGRVSKAKKGVKVHDCECGRSYTRAEHLRRHQRNHAQEGAMFCKHPDCGKTFYRTDLLQRHEERHSEVGNASRQPSLCSSEHSVSTSPRSMPAALPTGPLQPTLTYHPQQVLSSHPEVTAFSSDLEHQNLAFSTRHSISGPILADEGMNTRGHWHDSLAPSPYSCSSGYTSPVPEYNHTYATPPYGSGMLRTRASSNASFIGPWGHDSQSPISDVSNFQYSWPPEKNLIASSLSYVPVSYPPVGMPLPASLGPLGHYEHFCANNVAQIDHDESIELFPEGQYGMSPTAHIYQFEQYLNNYWRLFDPAFPIIHRPTFASLEAPPMLYAAMIAIGAQHSNNVCDRQVAAKLHKTCVKLLDNRDRSNSTRYDRLCDYQTIFLVEVFAQYCAQRCAKTLSPRFMTMYKKLLEIRSLHPSTILGLTSLVPTPADKVQDRWTQWAELSARQHLILSCHILEYQQFMLLARDCGLSLQIGGNDLPFPAHRSLWDATSPHIWIIATRQHLDSPATVLEALSNPVFGRYDTFRSAVLIVARYTPCSASTSGTDSDIESILDDSPPTIFRLQSAKLARLVPMRALLAVSGEAWILGQKVTSEPEFSALRITLQAWVEQLWSCAIDKYSQPTAEALRLSICILKQSLESREPFAWGIGNQMSLFLAALVVWATTVAASSRLASSLSSQQSKSLLASHVSMVAMMQPTVVSYATNHPTYLEPIHHFSEPSQDIQIMSNVPEGRAFLTDPEVLWNTSRFLTSAVEDITALNDASCHSGCASLLLWVKSVLRGAPVNNVESTAIDVGTNEDLHGELSHVIVDQIERMLNHGWEGWGI
ncbi:uncharacterized protein EKO05_0010324 [Ascochyta rabiei]|uniref:uncharacterized protein n=1 Tax=Didymella rabiei TaxID=5454 RepID=UPI00220268D3|nr:uncharacterized protein EKO05_0010324 [Ascochyta rabiei]UPX20079.1 hypothetical protein EKO05_0010324 [Ascochyta rabiei]